MPARIRDLQLSAGTGRRYAPAVIVVVGDGLVFSPDVRDSKPVAGRLAAIAHAAVRAGGTVQVVSKVGDDEAGEAVVLGLGRQGIGHVALLREAASPTLIERADSSPSDEATPDDEELAEVVADDS